MKKISRIARKTPFHPALGRMKIAITKSTMTKISGMIHVLMNSLR